MALTNSSLSSAPREVLLRLLLLRTPPLNWGVLQPSLGSTTMYSLELVVALKSDLLSTFLPGPLRLVGLPSMGPVLGRSMAAPQYHHGLFPYL